MGSLSINTNMAALTAHHYMEVNTQSMDQSIERLSSGLRINSAADDPAGMVISENMENQDSGLTVATQNTTNAVNMISTASSALDEVENQLRDMRNLALDASNANGDVQTLAADQAQMEQASQSIDRISQQTVFGNRQLLAGPGDNIQGMTFQIGADAGQTATFTLPTATFDGATLTANMSSASLGVTAGTAAATTAQVTAGTAMSANGITADETLYITGALGAGETSVSLTAASDTSIAQVVTDINAQANAVGVEAYASMANGTVSGTTADNTYLSFKSIDANGNDATGSTQAISVVSNMPASNGTGIGTQALTSTGQDSNGLLDLTVNTQANYTNIMNTVTNALNMVNGLQVNLGAFQANNLQSNLNSLATTQQNVESSESDIKDTDMAAEMVNFTRAQILSQAAQAMMTQANQAPQSILTMLRGQ